MMEAFHPSWELDIVRHTVHHLVRRIRLMGPLCAHSMFPFERMWNKLISWMTGKKQPATTIMNSSRELVSYATYSVD